MKKIIVICAAVLLFAPLLTLAAAGPNSATKQSYYLISLTWDSEKDAVTVNKDAAGKPAVSITDKNIISDKGTGSQFYSFVVNPALKYAIFKKTNSTKYFLGQWVLPESQKKGEIKVTIPFIAGASKIYILDSKSNKLAASVDVFELSKIETSDASKKTAVAQTQAQTPVVGAQTYAVGGHSAAYWWTMRIIILLILGGGGYFIWRWRKKKKMAQAGNVTNSQSAVKK